jgi:hypothetical protein
MRGCNNSRLAGHDSGGKALEAQDGLVALSGVVAAAAADAVAD